MKRTIELAIANAERLRLELPMLVQPSATDYDMVLLADEIEQLQTQLAAANRILSLCAFAMRQPFDDWKGIHEANALNAINKFAVTRGEKP